MINALSCSDKPPASCHAKLDHILLKKTQKTKETLTAWGIDADVKIESRRVTAVEEDAVGIFHLLS